VLAKDVDVIKDFTWELYNIADDFSQAEDLADKELAKLRELQDTFWIEATKYDMLPLDNSKVERFDVSNPPQPDPRALRVHPLRGIPDARCHAHKQHLNGRHSFVSTRSVTGARC
jgi:hypothetical protein